MRIGFSTWSFISLPVEEALRRIKDAGYTEVEIYADRAHLDPRLFPRWKLPHIKRVLEDLSLTPHSIHAPIDGVDLSAQSLHIRRRSIELLVETMEYCRALECPLLVVHPTHTDSLNIGYEAMRRNSIMSFEELAKRAEELEVKIAVENMIDKGNGRFGSRVTELREILEAAQSPYLGICIDTGHINLLKPRVSQKREIEQAGKYLWSLHIHDNDGRRDLHLPPGDGNIEWRQVIAGLKEVNYQGPFMMEIHERLDDSGLARECLEIAVKLLSM